MQLIENNLEVVEYDDLLLPISIKVRDLIQYENKRALCHWHDDIEIIKILSGTMNFYVNGEVFHLIENDMLMINSKQVHYGYEYRNDNCKFICLMLNSSVWKINESLYEKYVKLIIEDNKLSAWHFKQKEDNKNELDALFEELLLWNNSKIKAKEWKVLGLIYDLWYQIYTLISDKKIMGGVFKDDFSRDINIFKQMVAFIYQNYKNSISLQEIAQAGNIGKSKCCDLFRKYVNKTPIDFVNVYRLEKSKLLLKYKDLTITQVALNCGFNNGSYYAEIFKKYNQCTPSAFRKRLNKEN